MLHATPGCVRFSPSRELSDGGELRRLTSRWRMNPAFAILQSR